MTGPILRILARWAFVPLLLWFGLPPETVDLIVNDPDLQMLAMWLVPVVIGAVEGLYLWAKRKGWNT